jgi:F420-0:gamma-glutamyl ligase
MQVTGVCARGIVTPIFQRGDDLVAMVCDSVCKAAETEGFALRDHDIVAVTEAVLGRTQGNYATYGQITKDIQAKFGPQGGKLVTLGAVFPIQSRNRFSVLPAIAQATEKLILQLSYPGDEVGNQLVTQDAFDASGVNPYSDHFDEAGFRAVFGYETKHKFTGVDYIAYYKNINPNIEIVFSNDPRYILRHTKNVLCCDVHGRARTKKLLRTADPSAIVLGLDDILTQSVDGSGFNQEYGLLGHNLATDTSVKLFPHSCDRFVHTLQAALHSKTGKRFEVMIFADGGFKDPVGGIWEFDDPVISPGFTAGLDGVPNEIKLKYIADNEYAGLSGEALEQALREKIRAKNNNLVGNMASMGTTPRRIPDLLGSLCDLVSGSGDRGTPVVLIQNYFSNYASE